MKHTKKLISLLLALAMMLALTAPAFATEAGNGGDDDTDLSTGSIIIKNAVSEQTYKAYRILEVEYSSDGYLYKANSDWKEWLESKASQYITLDDNDYATWVATADVEKFAKLINDYVSSDGFNISANDTQKAENATVTFENLPFGYYLITTTLGTLCSLDTTTSSVTMYEKNVEPQNEKKVLEDNTYGNKNDAQIGETIKFQSTITAQAGAKNYVFHDKMSQGLTYTEVTEVTLNGKDVDSNYYTIVLNANDTTQLDNDTTQLDNDCTFHIIFDQSFCDTLSAGDKIIITYTATLNSGAVISENGNTNTSRLTYGDDSTSTAESTTTTYTWKFKVFKYAQEQDENGAITKKPLESAQFYVSTNDDASGQNSKITFVQPNETSEVYRVATPDDINDLSITTFTTIETKASGRFTIQGLDSGTYYLYESKAPDGYNKLSVPIEIRIDSNGEVYIGSDIDTEPVDEVAVLNQSGSELPSTGGAGTALFYIVGGILVVGAAVLLITKRRMENEEK